MRKIWMVPLIASAIGILVFFMLWDSGHSKFRNPWQILRLGSSGRAYRAAGMGFLSEIGHAISFYRNDNHGAFPFDERGPLASLALLYPNYLAAPSVFTSYAVTSQSSRQREGPFFPTGTSLAGATCHYGYTWHVPNDPPPDFAIAADLPSNFTVATHGPGYCVLYADGRVLWREKPFCSHDTRDNIFSPEPGWGADTDSFIRQR